MNLLEIFKPVEPETNAVKFLRYDETDTNQFALLLDEIKFSDDIFSETIDTVKNKIVETLNEFKEVEVTNSIELQKNCLQVARDTKRGVANVNFENCYWYNGVMALKNNEIPPNIDSPLSVVKRGDQYGVVKNPTFDSLGFKTSGFFDKESAAFASFITIEY